MPNDYQSSITRYAPVEDPPHKISYGQMITYLGKLNAKHFKGEILLRFHGKDDVIEMLFQEGEIHYTPLTTLEEVDLLIESQTEEGEE